MAVSEDDAIRQWCDRGGCLGVPAANVPCAMHCRERDCSEKNYRQPVRESQIKAGVRPGSDTVGMTIRARPGTQLHVSLCTLHEHVVCDLQPGSLVHRQGGAHGGGRCMSSVAELKRLPLRVYREYPRQG